MKQTAYQKNKESKSFRCWEFCRDLSEDALIALLDDSDAAISQTAAQFLQLKGGSTVIKLAQSDCANANYKRRALGAFILGQIKLSAFEEKKIVVLLHDLALYDKSANVRSNAVSSLAHRCVKSNKQATLLLELSTQTVLDSSSSVRQSTAFVLSTFYHESSIPLLLKLLNDRRGNVRDWAAFAVNMNEYNTPQLKDCFATLLNDSLSAVRYEAIIGLARMQDKRVTQTLIGELSKDEIYDELVKAAGDLGDTAMLPTLQAIMDKFEPFDELNRAITLLKKVKGKQGGEKTN